MRPIKAVISIAALSALALAACSSNSRDSGFEVVDSSQHEPASATTANRLACTDGDEAANFPYFSLGREFSGEEASEVARSCYPPPTEHLVGTNEVSFAYGPCKSLGSGDDSGCGFAHRISTSPACQLNYSWYHPPRGSNHARSKLKTWRNGAVSVTFFDLGETQVYTGTSTIKVGQGAKPADLAKQLDSIRAEPSVKPLGKPAGKAAGPVGIDSLPAPVPGAMAGKLRCDQDV